MANRFAVAVPLLLLEICTTMATAYQHHSEAKWEISAAYFGTAVGYLSARLVIWLPLALVLLMGTKLCYRPLAIGRATLVALALEVLTTLGSTLLSQRGLAYGIFFGSFGRYLGARLALWPPLVFGSLIVLTRPSGVRTRV
jgi:hypothetical protein